MRAISPSASLRRLHIYVGHDSQLMGAATRLAPKHATQLIAKQMKGLLAKP